MELFKLQLTAKSWFFKLYCCKNCLNDELKPTKSMQTNDWKIYNCYILLFRLSIYLRKIYENGILFFYSRVSVEKIGIIFNLAWKHEMKSMIQHNLRRIERLKQ